MVSTSCPCEGGSSNTGAQVEVVAGNKWIYEVVAIALAQCDDLATSRGSIHTVESRSRKEVAERTPSGRFKLPTTIFGAGGTQQKSVRFEGDGGVPHTPEEVEHKLFSELRRFLQAKVVVEAARMRFAELDRLRMFRASKRSTTLRRSSSSSSAEIATDSAKSPELSESSEEEEEEPVTLKNRKIEVDPML